MGGKLPHKWSSDEYMYRCLATDTILEIANQVSIRKCSSTKLWFHYNFFFHRNHRIIKDFESTSINFVPEHANTEPLYAQLIKHNFINIFALLLFIECDIISIGKKVTSLTDIIKCSTTIL